MTIRIFFSYCHKDKAHLERLTKHLAPLLREKDVDPWYDGNIDPGQAITPEIRKALRGTDIFVALASPDYLASDYCYRKEYRPTLRKSKEGRPKVVVALVGTCDWPNTEMAGFKMLPDDAKSVDKHGNRNQAYLEIVRGIRRVVRSVRQEKGKAQAEAERPIARANATVKNKVDTTKSVPKANTRKTLTPLVAGTAKPKPATRRLREPTVTAKPTGPKRRIAGRKKQDKATGKRSGKKA